MLKNLFLLSILLLFTACAPKIVSNKSPILSLKGTCFAIPTKASLLEMDINQQNLYSFTAKALDEFGFTTQYGASENCLNIIYTSWVVSSSESVVTQRGTTFTNTYGNAYANIYSNSVSGNAQTYSYTTPDYTYTAVDLRGTYTLIVSVIENDKFIDVWEGSQTGEMASSNLERAKSVTEKAYGLIKKMVKRMLQENGYLK